MTRADLDEFVECDRAADRHKPQGDMVRGDAGGPLAGVRLRRDPGARQESLDLFWLRDEILEDSTSLPEPHLLAQEIADDLRSALAQIEDVLGDLEQRVDGGASEDT
jgi:type I restriction enzyme M protein